MIKKVCAVSGQEFEIVLEDLDFYAKMEIISAEDLAKLKSREISDCVGLPKLYPEERQRRRFSWRNERKLYARKCDLCEKKIVSIYDEKTNLPIYCQKCWWSDKCDAQNFSRDFDFSQSFFSQFKELNKNTPKPGIINDNDIKSENSAYCQDCVNMKNCYLVVETGEAKDSMFSHQSNRSVEVIDCYQVMDSELVYESINSQKLYNCSFIQNSSSCSDCYFGYDLRSCKNCFGCINLRNKEYYFLNKKLSREDYEKKIEKINQSSFFLQSSLKKSFADFKRNIPHRYANFKNCEDCLGDNIFNCKKVLGYDVIKSQDSKFVNNVDQMSYIYDAQGWKSSWSIETQTVDESWMAKYSAWCENCKNIDYSIHCYSSYDLFGCEGLRNKKYCILNKQYTKEEYFKTREKIIEHMKKTGEWGEFFPTSLSPFAYNETVAQEYFPLTKEEAISKGYKWKDKISRDFKPASIKTIPDDISEVEDSICRDILACNNHHNPCQGKDDGALKCGKNYQIQKAELRFYRKMNLPIPRKCPDCRHADRMKLRNPRKLFERHCHDCNCEIQTTFSPERPEKVLCGECYLKIVD